MTREQAKSELMQIYGMLSEEKKQAIDVLMAQAEKTCDIEKSNFDVRQYKLDTDTAYECGYNAGLQAQADGEYISREAVIDIIEDVCPIYENDYRYILREKVNELPIKAISSAEPKIVPIAEIKFDDDMLHEIVEKAVKNIEIEPKWIPVNERLPEKNMAVLTYVSTGPSKTYCLAYWNDVRGGWEEWIGYELIEKDRGYKVLAWMPLPKAYEPLESEEQTDAT